MSKREKTINILRNLLKALLRVLEKISRHFAVDHRGMGSSGLMRDQWAENQRQFEYMLRKGDIYNARNDRTNEK